MFSVLFVDDGSDLLIRIRTFLEKSGEIRVDGAHSLKQATEKLKARSYDLILSYDHMPDVNGIEFVSEMNGIEFVKYLRSARQRDTGYPVLTETRRQAHAERGHGGNGDLHPCNRRSPRPVLRDCHPGQTVRPAKKKPSGIPRRRTISWHPSLQ